MYRSKLILTDSISDNIKKSAFLSLINKFSVNSDCEIIFPKNSPPLLTGSQLYCSLSHTKGALFAALSDTPIGVDIERRVQRNFPVDNPFFSSEEKNYLKSSAILERDFYILWTMKESYYKMRFSKGMGALPLPSFVNKGKLIDKTEDCRFILKADSKFVRCICLQNLS